MNKWPMTALATCSTMVGSAHGESRESDLVARLLKELHCTLQDSRSIGVQALVDDLAALAEECSEPGWDGYEARPIDARSIANAEQFIDALGFGVRHPSLGANAKGWVTMQWGRSARWTLSLAITDDGWIHWAMLFGSERSSGTTPFAGRISKDLRELINRASNT
jgi:hypothetical protein